MQTLDSTGSRHVCSQLVYRGQIERFRQALVATDPPAGEARAFVWFRVRHGCPCCRIPSKSWIWSTGNGLSQVHLTASRLGCFTRLKEGIPLPVDPSVSLADSSEMGAMVRRAMTLNKGMCRSTAFARLVSCQSSRSLNLQLKG